MDDISPRTAARIAEALRRCISASVDASKGYALAAANAHDPAFVAALRATSAQRDAFATRLRDLVHLLGQQDGDGGTALGALHRAAVDVQLAVAGRSDRLVAEECDRGERAAQRVYELARAELVRAAAPKAIREIVDAQYAAVCNARFELHRRITATPIPPSPGTPPERAPR